MLRTHVHDISLARMPGYSSCFSPAQTKTATGCRASPPARWHLSPFLTPTFPHTSMHLEHGHIWCVSSQCETKTSAAKHLGASIPSLFQYTLSLTMKRALVVRHQTIPHCPSQPSHHFALRTTVAPGHQAPNRSGGAACHGQGGACKGRGGAANCKRGAGVCGRTADHPAAAGGGAETRPGDFPG